MNATRSPKNGAVRRRKARLPVSLWTLVPLCGVVLTQATGAAPAAVVTGASAVAPVPPGLDALRTAVCRGQGQSVLGVLGRLLDREDLAAGVRTEALVLTARVHLDAGALDRVETLLRGMDSHPEASLCLAQAALRGGRWSVAAERFAQARGNGAAAAECALGLASALPKIGRALEARELLRPLVGEGVGGNPLRLAWVGLLLETGAPGEAERVLGQTVPETPAEELCVKFLRARLQALLGRGSEALGAFEEILQGRVPAPHEVLAGSVLGVADVLEERGDVAGALRRIFSYLRSGRELPFAEPLFQKAVDLLHAPANGSGTASEVELEACVRTGPAEYRALARFYLAQFYLGLGRGARAGEHLGAFCEEHPEHRLRAAAFLQRAELAMDASSWGEAGRWIDAGLSCVEDPALRGVLELRAGLVAFRQGAHETALSIFEGVASRRPALLVEATFNGALAALAQGNLRKADSLCEVLTSAQGGAELATELELRIALRRAREERTEASDALRTFIQRHPSHARLGDARVALAELYVREAERAKETSGTLSARVLRERAGELLRLVAGDAQSPQSAAQARYLAVFLADAAEPRNEEEILEQGEAFLRDFSGSPLAPGMRMKLGEVYFRRKDFANAESHFAAAGALAPLGERSEVALYLAGQCAANRLNPGSVDDALGYWEKVAQGGGALRWKARFQQASVKARLGEEADASELFARVANAQDGVDDELRFAALCGRADALLAHARRNALPLEEALQGYRQLAAFPDLPARWRNQALYKVAKALEPTDPQAALEGYHAVLDAPGSLEAGEFFWLYQAGFSAARILEGRKAWRDSVALYERLGKLGGARSAEAGARALQIRLERFLWD